MNRLEKIQIEGIYIIHALKGYEVHEARINQLFKKNDLNFTFITDGDPSLDNRALERAYFIPEIDQKLSKGVKACTFNHILAYERMLKNDNEYAIIFENDPFFLTDFVEDLEKMAIEMQQLPKGFIISIENTTLRFPSFWQTKPNQYFYQASSGRAAGAYIIDKTAAKNILTDLKTTKCHTVIDWWHNSLIERGIVSMYWSHPALVEQGSHNGLLHSTISSKNKSVIRQLRWATQKIYKSTFLRLFNAKEIIG